MKGVAMPFGHTRRLLGYAASPHTPRATGYWLRANTPVVSAYRQRRYGLSVGHNCKRQYTNYHIIRNYSADTMNTLGVQYP